MWNVIEKYIKENREAIDRDEPREELWDQIAAQLPSKAPVQEEEPGDVAKVKPLSIMMILRTAVAVLILGAIGTGLYNNFVAEKHLELKSLQSSLLDHKQVDSYPDLRKIDSSFVAEANQLLRVINGYDLDNYTFVKPFREELDELDRLHNMQKDRLEKEGLSEELKTQINNTYHEKLLLLEKLLRALNAEEN